MRIVNHRFLVLALAAGAGAPAAGCSHQQKVAAHPAMPAPPAMAARDTGRGAGQLSTVADGSADGSKNKEGGEIFFDFDSATLRDDARPVLQKVAASLRGRDDEGLRVEGNCDELGTVEYNIALGEQRARAAKEYLVHLGVPPARIDTVSYGAQRPKYAGHDDQARARNRRDDLVVR